MREEEFNISAASKVGISWSYVEKLDETVRIRCNKCGYPDPFGGLMLQSESEFEEYDPFILTRRKDVGEGTLEEIKTRACIPCLIRFADKNPGHPEIGKLEWCGDEVAK